MLHYRHWLRIRMCLNLVSHAVSTISTTDSDYSRMRSKGSRFTLRVWGLGVCSLDVAQPSAIVRNRPQPRPHPFATVRNRPREPRMAVPMVSSARGHSWRFKSCVASFRMAGVALRDIPTCFVMCRKAFCVWQSQYFCDVFRKDEFQFSWQAQHFERVHAPSSSSFCVAGATL